MAQVIRAMKQANEDVSSNKRVHVLNTERLKEIVYEIGFPTKSKVGRAGALNALLLMQYTDHDVPFQKYCLNLMKTEKLGEVSKKDIENLELRIKANESAEELRTR